jgi:sulfofructose kinase
MDVLCVGHASYDLVFSIKEHIFADQKAFADDFVSCGGGPASNAAVTAARLGCRTAYMGYLGLDNYGEKHFQELKQEGIILDFIFRGHDPTPLSVILVKPDGKRSIVNYRKSTKQIQSSDLDLSSLHPKLILFDGHEPKISLPICQAARSNAATTILDAGSVHEGTLALMDKVDFLICSQKFAIDFTGDESLKHALDHLGEINSSVIITLGEEGIIWKHRCQTGKLASYKVNVVDTTGAGDIFHGAFAACTAKGIGFSESIYFASAAAALTCTQLGARSSIPFENEVIKFMQSNNPIY